MVAIWMVHGPSNAKWPLIEYDEEEHTMAKEEARLLMTLEFIVCSSE